MLCGRESSPTRLFEHSRSSVQKGRVVPRREGRCDNRNALREAQLRSGLPEFIESIVLAEHEERNRIRPLAWAVAKSQSRLETQAVRIEMGHVDVRDKRQRTCRHAQTDPLLRRIDLERPSDPSLN